MRVTLRRRARRGSRRALGADPLEQHATPARRSGPAGRARRGTRARGPRGAATPSGAALARSRRGARRSPRAAPRPRATIRRCSSSGGERNSTSANRPTASSRGMRRLDWRRLRRVGRCEARRCRSIAVTRTRVDRWIARCSDTRWIVRRIDRSSADRRPSGRPSTRAAQSPGTARRARASSDDAVARRASRPARPNVLDRDRVGTRDRPRAVLATCEAARVPDRQRFGAVATLADCDSRAVTSMRDGSATRRSSSAELRRALSSCARRRASASAASRRESCSSIAATIRRCSFSGGSANRSCCETLASRERGRCRAACARLGDRELDDVPREAASQCRRRRLVSDANVRSSDRAIEADATTQSFRASRHSS